MSHLFLATDSIGQTIENNTGDKLGKIDDIVIDSTNGQCIYSIVSFDGFMGTELGDKKIAVPQSSLTWDEGEEVLKVNFTKEFLGNSPELEDNDDIKEAACQQKFDSYFNNHHTSLAA